MSGKSNGRKPHSGPWYFQVKDKLQGKCTHESVRGCPPHLRLVFDLIRFEIQHVMEKVNP